MKKNVIALSLGLLFLGLSVAGCSRTKPEPTSALNAIQTETYPGLCPSDPVLFETPYVGDTKTNPIILHDADVFWGKWRAFATHQEQADNIRDLILAENVPFWLWGARAVAFLQMYDLVVSIDHCRAELYFERVRRMANAFLAYRDDQRSPQKVDEFRKRVMAAWGAKGHAYDNKWTSDIVVAGLFTYPMAAFARRVAENPSAFSAQYQQDAIRFTTAVIETYLSFRDDLVLPDTKPWAYYKLPPVFATLQCNLPEAGQCLGYKGKAQMGDPVSWNESLSMMRSLSEVAVAANSGLYRSSPDSVSKQFTVYYATQEAPRAIAKNVAHFIDNLTLLTWSSDGAKYYEWNHEFRPPPNKKPQTQDTSHASFELESLAVIYANKAKLDSLLLAANRLERVMLDATIMKRFATTFLRKIWVYDFNNPSAATNNFLDKNVKGTGGHTLTSNANGGCSGFLPLAQVDPWVWVRCRDNVFNRTGPYLFENNHAALLLYR
jgi:hypothetical protein